MYLRLAKYSERPLNKIFTQNKGTTLSFVLLLIYGQYFGQKKDSIPEKITAYVADKFPSTRVLNIEHYQLASHKFNSSLLNGPQTSGEISNMHQTKINLTPISLKREGGR